MDVNTSGGLTKAVSSANIRNLLTRDTFRIVTEEKKMPSPKHYTVSHAEIQGGEDLDVDMRRRTRAGRGSHWEMALGDKRPLNSNKLHGGG